MSHILAIAKEAAERLGFGHCRTFSFISSKGSSDDISDILTMLGLEAESLPDLSGLDDIVIGEVRECSKHPNADRLNICKVFDGKDELPIVCGAPNVRKVKKSL